MTDPQPDRPPPALVPGWIPHVAGFPPGAPHTHNHSPHIMKNRNEYISEAKQALDDLNTRVDKLEHQLAGKKIEASAAWQSRLNDLKLKRRQVNQQLENLKSASEDSWQTLREGVDKVLGDLRETLVQAKDDLKKALS